MSEYDDIINLPHHVSTKHPQMSMEQRAAQFAPFAALTGLDDEMDETAMAAYKQVIDENTNEAFEESILPSGYRISLPFSIHDRIFRLLLLQTACNPGARHRVAGHYVLDISYQGRVHVFV